MSSPESSPNLILPQSFNILTTQRCNLACDYCEFSCTNSGAYLKKEIFEKILREGRELKINNYYLDGGEFLVHPQAGEILDLIGHYQVHAELLTNGLLFKQFLPRLKKNKVTRVLFGLDGVTPSINDKIKGRPGATRQTLAAIQSARQNGFQVGLHFTLSAANYLDFANFLKFARSIKADPLLISRVNLTGRALKSKTAALLDSSMKQKIVTAAYQKYSYHPSGFFAYSLPRHFNQRPQKISTQDFLQGARQCKYFSGQVLAIDWHGRVCFCALEPSLGRGSRVPGFSLTRFSLSQCLRQLADLRQQIQTKIQSGPKQLSFNPNQRCSVCYRYFKDF